MNKMTSNIPLMNNPYSIADQIAIDHHCKEILCKDSLKRTNLDIDYLLSNKLLIQFSFIKTTFQTENYGILRLFLKAIKIRHLKPNEEIYHIGEPSTNVYILLEGILKIFIPNPNYKPWNINKAAKSDPSSFLKTIESTKQIKQGEIFGEKELIFPSLRESTIVSSTHVILGKVDKMAFSKLFKNSMKKYQTDYQKLFKSMKLFKKKEKKFIDKILREMSLIKLKPNEVLMTKGQQCDMIYIIKSGRIRVIDTDKYTNVTDELFIYKPGELIGDIELCLSIDSSLFTLISTDANDHLQCEILYCKRDVFMRLLDNFKVEFTCYTQAKIRKIKAKKIECYRNYLWNSDMKNNYENDLHKKTIKTATLIIPNKTHNQVIINIDGEDQVFSDTSKMPSIFTSFRNKSTEKTEIYRRHSSYVDIKSNNNNIMKYHRRDNKSITAVEKKLGQKNDVKELQKIISVYPSNMRKSNCCLKLSSFSSLKQPKITFDNSDNNNSKIAAYGDNNGYFAHPLINQHLKPSTRLGSLMIARHRMKYNTYNPRLSMNCNKNNNNFHKENSTSYCNNILQEPIGQYEVRNNNLRPSNEGIQIQLSRKSLQSSKLREVCCSKLMYMNKEIIGPLLNQKYNFLRSHSQLTLLK